MKQTKAQKIRAIQNKIDTEKAKQAKGKENLAQLRASLKHTRVHG